MTPGTNPNDVHYRLDQRLSCLSQAGRPAGGCLNGAQTTTVASLRRGTFVISTCTGSVTPSPPLAPSACWKRHGWVPEETAYVSSLRSDEQGKTAVISGEHASVTITHGDIAGAMISAWASGQTPEIWRGIAYNQKITPPQRQRNGTQPPWHGDRRSCNAPARPPHLVIDSCHS